MTKLKRHIHTQLLTKLCSEQGTYNYPHIKHYEEILACLPPSWSLALSGDILQITPDQDAESAGCNPQARDNFEDLTQELIKLLIPWRKGPFTLGSCPIDGEWRAEKKWHYIEELLPDLQDRLVLEVGCSSGYHLLRLLLQSPRTLVGLEPYGVSYYQLLTFKRLIKNVAGQPLREDSFLISPLRSDDFLISRDAESHSSYDKTAGYQELARFTYKSKDLSKTLNPLTQNSASALAHTPNDLKLLTDKTFRWRPQFNFILCMGVLYHQKDIFGFISTLYNSLFKGGTLILETFVYDHLPPDTLFSPKDRFMMMPNVWFIPTESYVISALRRQGFRDIIALPPRELTPQEQRSTPLAPHYSLNDYIKGCKTLEGYEIPKMQAFRALR